MTGAEGVRVYGFSLTFYEPISDNLRNAIQRATLSRLTAEKRASSSSSSSSRLHDQEYVSLSPPALPSKPAHSMKSPSSLASPGEEASPTATAKSSPLLPPKVPPPPPLPKSLRSNTIYATRAICLLSHWPYFNVMREYLTELYRMSLSIMPLPVERFLGNLLFEVPLPPRGGVDVHFVIGSKECILSRPAVNELPLLNFPLLQLVTSLSPEVLIQCWSSLLMERNVIFVSSTYSQLTFACEALIALMFPFVWMYVYVPVVPRNMLGMVESPMPYLFGVHSSHREALVDLPPGTVVVDLDRGTLHATSASGSGNALPKCPDKQYHKLIKVLEEVRGHNDLLLRQKGGTQAVGADIAFDQSALPGLEGEEDAILAADGRERPGAGLTMEECEQLIRKGFFRFFVSVFLDYRQYLVADARHLSEMSKLEDMFNVKEFILSHHSKSRRWIGAFLKTMAFQKFVYEHIMEVNAVHVRLFDEHIAAKRNRSARTTHKYPTPFLDEIVERTEVYAVPAPVAATVAEGNPTEFHSYSRWPLLEEGNFGKPRLLPKLLDRSTTESVGHRSSLHYVQDNDQSFLSDRPGIPPSVRLALFNAYLEINCAKILGIWHRELLDRLLQACDAMKQKGICPSPEPFAVLLAACGRCHAQSEALRVYQSFRALGGNAPMVDCALVACMVESGDVENAAHVVRALKLQATVAEEVAVILMGGFGKQQRCSLARQLWEQTPSQSQPQQPYSMAVAYAAAVGECGQPDSARMLLQEWMEDEKRAGCIDERLIAAVMAGYAQAGLLYHCQDLCDEAAALQIDGNVAMLGSIMDCLGRNGHVESAHEIMSEWESEGVVLTPAIQLQMLQCLAYSGYVELAFKTCLSLPSVPMERNPWLLVAWAACAAGNATMAMEALLQCPISEEQQTIVKMLEAFQLWPAHSTGTSIGNSNSHSGDSQSSGEISERGEKEKDKGKDSSHSHSNGGKHEMPWEHWNRGRSGKFSILSNPLSWIALRQLAVQGDWQGILPVLQQQQALVCVKDMQEAFTTLTIAGDQQRLNIPGLCPRTIPLRSLGHPSTVTVCGHYEDVAARLQCLEQLEAVCQQHDITWDRIMVLAQLELWGHGGRSEVRGVEAAWVLRGFDAHEPRLLLALARAYARLHLPREAMEYMKRAFILPESSHLREAAWRRCLGFSRWEGEVTELVVLSVLAQHYPIEAASWILEPTHTMGYGTAIAVTNILLESGHSALASDLFFRLQSQQSYVSWSVLMYLWERATDAGDWKIAVHVASTWRRTRTQSLRSNHHHLAATDRSVRANQPSQHPSRQRDRSNTAIDEAPPPSYSGPTSTTISMDEHAYEHDSPFMWDALSEALQSFAETQAPHMVDLDVLQAQLQEEEEQARQLAVRLSLEGVITTCIRRFQLGEETLDVDIDLLDAERFFDSEESETASTLSQDDNDASSTASEEQSIEAPEATCEQVTYGGVISSCGRGTVYRAFGIVMDPVAACPRCQQRMHVDKVRKSMSDNGQLCRCSKCDSPFKAYFGVKLIESGTTLTWQYYGAQHLKEVVDGLMSRSGAKVFVPSILREKCPSLYWNLIWHFVDIQIALEYLRPDIQWEKYMGM
jgi:pentatricopeptide repeat protein